MIVDPVVNAVGNGLTGVLDATGPGAESLTADLGAGIADTASMGATVNAALFEVSLQLDVALHATSQDYLASSLGQTVDPIVNAPSVYLFGRDLVGDGVNDFSGTNHSLLGSSGLFGNLGDGGFLFGDGGVGAAGVVGVDHGAGSAGGSAGLIGDGGAG
ncbi:hypothetical protein ACQV26_04080, partial [Mycobacterium sp. Lab-001]